MNKAVPYLLVATLALALLGVVGYASIKGLSDLADEGYDGYEPQQDRAGSPNAYLVLFAETWPSPMSAPPRFRAPLPRVSSDVTPDRYPPPWFVAVQLSHGELDARRELLEAMREAADRGASRSELRMLYGEMLYSWTTEEHCAWLRSLVETPTHVFLRQDAWGALAWCHDPTSRAFFTERDDLTPPAFARLEHAAQTTAAGTATWSASLADAMVEVARLGTMGDVEAGAKTVLALDHDRGAAALARARAATPYADVRAAIDRLLAAPPPAMVPVEHADLDALVRAPSVDLDGVSRQIGARREELVRALVRCAVGEGGPLAETAHACLKTLARLDRRLAVPTARTALRRDFGEARLVEVATALTEYASTEDLIARLGELELVGFEARSPVSLEDVDAFDVLRSRRRALCIDTVLDADPAPNDSLAQRLAFLTRPALVGAVFEQETSWDGGMTSLHGYHRGQRWTVSLGSPPDYDRIAAVGLLNSMLRDQGSEIRLALMRAGAAICAVAGKEPSLVQLDSESLITFEWWDSPTLAGD